MGRFSILTNRKRAVVALVHSVVFLLVAVRQMVAANPAAGIWIASTVSRGTWILCGIFALVSAILLWLVSHLPRMDGKILFRILYPQRHNRPASDRCRRPGVSCRHLHSRRHADQCGAGWTSHRSDALPPDFFHILTKTNTAGCLAPCSPIARGGCLTYIAESELKVSATAFQLPSGCLA
jgi:hypothetical protein